LICYGPESNRPGETIDIAVFDLHHRHRRHRQPHRHQSMNINVILKPISWH
jgi:hypothetical protein